MLSHQFPTESEPATGIYVLEQMRALRKLGADLLVMAPTPWVPPLLKRRLSLQRYTSVPPQAVVDGFHVIYPRVLTLPRGLLFSLTGLFFYFSCRRRLAELLRTTQIDLIHAHTIMPDGFAAVLLGREFKIPTVCTIHGSDVNLYPWRSRLSYLAIRWALLNTDNLIAVSQKLKDKVHTIAGSLDVAVAHNGADSQKFKPMDKSEARRVLGLPLNRKILLFVGNLWKVKGIAFLIQAVQQLAQPDLDLYVVGDGDLRERLTKQAADAGLQSACNFAGLQPHDRIPLWLSAADCLVLPSLSEGLPTILCEAMLCKTPIVATDVGGVSEIVRNRITGLLVPPGDRAALANAIREQLAHPSLTVVEDACRSAEQNLTWESNALKTMSVYQGVLSSQSMAGSNGTVFSVTRSD